jgi:hypothetical protein
LTDTVLVFVLVASISSDFLEDGTILVLLHTLGDKSSPVRNVWDSAGNSTIVCTSTREATALQEFNWSCSLSP